MKKITDKRRLDFLQSLMKRKAKMGTFTGLVVDVSLDSFLRIYGGEKAFVALGDHHGRADDGHLRSAKTVRRAIDKAIAHVQRLERLNG